MSELSEAVKEATKRYLTDRGYAVEKVDSFYDYTTNGGYCDTCSYSEYYVEIRYTDTNGKNRTYEYEGRFSSLLENLLES